MWTTTPLQSSEGLIASKLRMCKKMILILIAIMKTIMIMIVIVLILNVIVVKIIVLIYVWIWIMTSNTSTMNIILIHILMVVMIMMLYIVTMLMIMDRMTMIQYVITTYLYFIFIELTQIALGRTYKMDYQDRNIIRFLEQVRTVYFGSNDGGLSFRPSKEVLSVKLLLNNFGNIKPHDPHGFKEQI